MKTQTLDNEQEIKELLEHASQAEATGDFAAAIESAQKAVGLAQESHDPGSEATGYLGWGRALWRQGDLDAAQSKYEQALALAQEAGARQVEANSLRGAGLVAWNQGDYAAARSLFERSLRAAREIGDQWGEGWTLNNFGVIFSEQGDYARSRAYYETALRTFREIGEVRGEVSALANLGWAFSLLGDYGASKVYTEQALHAAHELGDRDGESRTLSNLGFLLHLQGNDQVALEHNQQALAIAEEIGSRSNQAGALIVMGHNLLGLGRATEAAEAYERALAISREMGQHHMVIEILAGLARAAMVREDLDQAQVYVEEILDHLETRSLDGAAEPIRVCLTCYRVLYANQDPRAETVLNMGHRLLQERAANIRNAEMRNVFLKSVAAHREVLEIVRGFAEATVGDEKTEVKSDERKTKAQLLDELTRVRRRNSELEMVASELGYIEETMGEREQRFRSIAETAGDAIILFDTYETIFFWNQAAQEIFGYQAHEAHGRLLDSIVTRAIHQTLRQEIERVIETGTSDLFGKAIEVTGVQKSGAEFPLELSIATWKTKDEIFFTAIGRDITDRKQAQARLERRAVQLQAAAELSHATTSMLDPDELLGQAVDLVREQFGLYHVGLFLLDEKRQFAILRASTGEAGRTMLDEGYKLAVGNESMIGGCITNAQARIALDVAGIQPGEQVTRIDHPLLPETRSEMALPLVSRGEVIGAMSIQSTQAAAFSKEDVSVFQTMTDQVAVAIDNAQLFAQTQVALDEAALAKEVAEKAQEKAEQAREEAETANQALEAQIWQTTGQAQLGDKMRGEQDIPTLANNIVQQLCHYLGAQIGALYMVRDQSVNLVGRYAYSSQGAATSFKFGEGLVGQAALEKQPMMIANLPNDYITVRSGLGEAVPRNIMVLPVVYEDRVVGVIELGTLAEFTAAQMEFLQAAMTNIGITFTTAQARARIDELLTETQQQAEELQAQSEELRAANEELQIQTESLERSEAELRRKQGELETANTELEERAAALQEKQIVLDRQNQELRTAQAELEQKARELAQASKYKSEFLANMSHELRTPLNSLLILAGMLKNNEDGNFTADQVESLEVIHNSGRDLLELINEILDLSKVEAGRMEFHFEPMSLGEIAQMMEAQFNHVAQEKGLSFTVSLAEDLPATIKADQQRVQQILKNLLSNAFKFTETGRVSLEIYRPATLPARIASKSGLELGQVVAIDVSDTGIGIAPEDQQSVFEAFQQVQSGTSRQYGGTGLGLSISRELSIRLGGFLALESEPGKGSVFTLYLPLERVKVSTPPAPQPPAPLVVSAQAKVPMPAPIPDDRDELNDGDRILLVIEDDAEFAQIVYDFAHRKNFKCLLAVDGETGLRLAETYRPEAIVLDLYLPGMNGWEVLDVLKDNPDTRHIPVHIMSADTETLDAYKRGAMDFLTKPVSAQDLEGTFQKIESFIEREIKTLLLVEDEEGLRHSIKKLLGGSDVQISEASTGQAALDLLRSQHFDCMILDLSLPDISGFEVLNRIDENETITKCPVIVYTGRDLTTEENLELMRYADSVIVKGVKSPERLLDETALFLHRVVADMPEDKQQTIKRLHDKEALLTGKRILLVDDDARSAFALSKLLADKGMKVSIARDGQQALDFLVKTPEVDLVLMDVMMPVMDGYETTRRIRAQRQFKTLPILALTAKAMVGDREKCLEAGANDYLPKPIDAERLFSMLRVWLYQ